MLQENDIYKVGHGVQGERWNFKSTKNIMLCKRGSTYEKNKGIMFLGLVVALLVIGFSPISEAASIEGKREKATIQKQNVEEQDTEEIACSSEG